MIVPFTDENLDHQMFSLIVVGGVGGWGGRGGRLRLPIESVDMLKGMSEKVLLVSKESHVIR